jgi:DNA-binding MarR family transcriptional regulator
MSNHLRNRQQTSSKAALIDAVGRSIQAFQDATDEVDEAVAQCLHLNRTDLRCLSVLARAGSLSARALADAAGLTRGAMTTALDRLEAAGYVRRVWDQEDRRSVRLELTEAAHKEVASLYGPLATEGARVLQTYSAAELEAVLRYLQDGHDLQRAHARRIRERAARQRAGKRRARQ